MKVLVQNEKGAASTFPAHRPIIIEHLLTHTSGLTYNFFGNAVSKIYAANGVDSDGGSVDTRGKFRVPDQGLHFYYAINLELMVYRRLHRYVHCCKVLSFVPLRIDN